MTNRTFSFDNLTDAALIEQLTRLAQSERGATANLIAALAEIRIATRR